MRGQRHDPIRRRRQVVREVAALEHEAVVVDRDELPLLRVASGERRHLLEIVVPLAPDEGILTPAEQDEKAERRRADARERAAPERTVVGNRGVGVARERHRVRERAQRGGGVALVLPPCPRRGARALRVEVLRVEKRLRARQLAAVALEERGDRALLQVAVVVVVMHAHELVALHCLHVHRRIVLVEHALPALGHVQREDVVAVLLLRDAELLRGTIVPAVDVVVARHEDLLDVLAVGTLVAGEHAPPRFAHAAQLRVEPAVGHVAGDQHGVHLLVAEISQGLLEDVARALPARDVDVGEDAEPEPRRSLRAERAMPHPRRSQKRERALSDERTPRLRHALRFLSVHSFFLLFLI